MMNPHIKRSEFILLSDSDSSSSSSSSSDDVVFIGEV